MTGPGRAKKCDAHHMASLDRAAAVTLALAAVLLGWWLAASLRVGGREYMTNAERKQEDCFKDKGGYWSPSHQACRSAQDCKNSGGKVVQGRCEGYGYKLNAGTFAMYNTDNTNDCREGTRKYQGECLTEKEFCRARGKWWYKNRCNDKPDPTQVASGGGGGDWDTAKERCSKQKRVWFRNTCMSKPQYCRAKGDSWKDGECVDKPPEDKVKSDAEKQCESGGNTYYQKKCMTEGQFCRARGNYWWGGKCRKQPQPGNKEPEAAPAKPDDAPFEERKKKRSSETAAVAVAPGQCEYVPAWFINTGDGWECPDSWKRTGINWANADRYGLKGSEQCARTEECVQALYSRPAPPVPAPDAPAVPAATMATSSLLDMVDI